MHEDIRASTKAITTMSSQEAESFFAQLVAGSKNELVKIQWDVTYDRLGKDMHSVAQISLVHEGDALLQVWLKNAAGGIWIPETQPWEISVVEFSPGQLVTSAQVGLLDSKWTGDDIGRRYLYQLWGYIQHAGNVESFALEKWGTYPGDA